MFEFLGWALRGHQFIMCAVFNLQGWAFGVGAQHLEFAGPQSWKCRVGVSGFRPAQKALADGPSVDGGKLRNKMCVPSICPWYTLVIDPQPFHDIKYIIFQSVSTQRLLVLTSSNTAYTSIYMIDLVTSTGTARNTRTYYADGHGTGGHSETTSLWLHCFTAYIRLFNIVQVI